MHPRRKLGQYKYICILHKFQTWVHLKTFFHFNYIAGPIATFAVHQDLPPTMCIWSRKYSGASVMLGIFVMWILWSTCWRKRYDWTHSWRPNIYMHTKTLTSRISPVHIWSAYLLHSVIASALHILKLERYRED